MLVKEASMVLVQYIVHRMQYNHYDDVIMNEMASQITSLTIDRWIPRTKVQ